MALTRQLFSFSPSQRRSPPARRSTLEIAERTRCSAGLIARADIQLRVGSSRRSGPIRSIWRNRKGPDEHRGECPRRHARGGRIRIACAKLPAVDLTGTTSSSASATRDWHGRVIERYGFEPFFTTKPEGEGTGLGLATSMDCASDRGQIDVGHSMTWGNARPFRIRLPRNFRPADACGKPPDKAPGLWRASNGQTVLLVEDDRAGARPHGEVLNKMGFACGGGTPPTKGSETAADPGTCGDRFAADRCGDARCDEWRRTRGQGA